MNFHLAEFLQVLQEEATKYLQSLHTAGMAVIEAGASLQADLKKAQRFYDKADEGMAGKSLDVAGMAYLNFLRFSVMVSRTCAQHAEWSESSQKKTMTKKLAIAVKKVEILKGSLIEMHKAGMRQKMSGGGGS